MSRQVHLARLFDEEQGSMGLYADAFIHHIRNSDALTSWAQKKRFEPYCYKKAPKTHMDLEDINSNQLVRELKDKSHKVNLTSAWAIRSYARSSNNSFAFDLSEDLETFLKNENRIFFGTGERHLKLKKFKVRTPGCPHAKLSRTAFAKSAENLYAHTTEDNAFIDSPYTIIYEGITSIYQVMRWLLMHCETAEDVISQMQAAVSPTVIDPRSGEKISPVQMMGYGNNGAIGARIDGGFPTHLNNRRIIRNATEDNPNIVSKKFVEFWFNRELDIGGCPALVYRRRIGGVYMDFARMYVECAEKLVEHSERLKAKQTVALEQDNSPEI